MESELTFPCNTLSLSLLLPASSAICKENVLFQVKQPSCYWEVIIRRKAVGDNIVQSLSRVGLFVTHEL